MPTPTLNEKAPEFSILDQEGRMHTLKDYAGKYVLLYFYPKDMTPGCTIEALQFRDYLKEFVKLNTQILGVSVDPCDSHMQFARKHQLNFPLLADTEHRVVDAYGVWNQKSMFGKKYMGITRESFLIDPKGVIIKHYAKVEPRTHAKDVINDVKKLS
ncbi:MAG: thioredoxin-dependent thiol peroxidase [Candidatus Kerfeldbacteria bacterium]|nr:thioredoxin-dependent thiol peroxidase [Candidatus Kerfeldbacteria bacterium]